MESVIPETGETFGYYLENKEIFLDAVQVLTLNGYDALISKTEYYSVEGSEDIQNCYIQKMEDQSVSEYTESSVLKVFDHCNVKLIDVIFRDELVVCSFDMCIPGRNYDFGIYYVSEDKPIYLGDPSITLLEKQNGFSYEQSASYGTKFTYYTEKIDDNFYYYEIM